MTNLLVLAFVLLALLGAPIFIVLAAFALLGAHAVNPAMPLDQAFAGELVRVLALATGSGALTLATLPLFVFAGYVMAEAKSAERMVAMAEAWLGWLPGGLAIATIAACAIFTTVTGASGVTIVAIGGLIYPQLLKSKYKERYALGLVTGTGSVGLLFPPALPLIVYGIVYGMSVQGLSDETSTFRVETFLFSGIFPGFLLIAVLALHAIVVAVRSHVPVIRVSTAEFWRFTLRALPEVSLPFLIVVAIASGALQVHEAAACAVVYVLILEIAVFRDVPVRRLAHIAREAMTLVGAIFVIIVAATALTDFFVNYEVPERLYEWMNRFIASKWTFLLALNGLLLIVGCLMDIFTAILVVVPLITPAAIQYGIDPYHLGIIFLLNLEIGYLTPPVGLNLFITSFRFRKPMVDVYRAAIPFIVLMLIALLLVTYLPLTFPKTLALLRLFERPVPGEKKEAEPSTAPVADAGPEGVKIQLDDGGVTTMKDCELPDIKEDPLAYAECQAKFKLYPRCDGLETELDKLECRQKVLAGENPFEEEPSDETEAAPDGGP